VECDSLIELMCKQGKGKKQSETVQLHHAQALFDKNYNKWYICEDNSMVWHPSFPKGKYLVLACMVEEDKLFENYEDILVENSNEWNAYSIYVLEDASYILFVRDNLYNKC
jgi:hypothetical protein